MRTPPLPLMIFAAGFGTRMRPLTETRPKPLVRVGGRTLLDHALALGGARRCVVNAHYLGHMIADHLRGRPDVAISMERGAILDTGGGLRAARGLLGAGPVLTLNPDAVWRGPDPLDLLEAAFAPARMDALLMLVPRGAAHAHAGAGDFIPDAQGRLTRGPGLVYGGAQVIAPAAVAALPEGPVSLNAAWDGAAARGRLFGLTYPGAWCDVGHPDAIAVAQRLLEGGTDG